MALQLGSGLQSLGAFAAVRLPKTAWTISPADTAQRLLEIVCRLRLFLNSPAEVQQAARSLFGTYLAALPDHRIVDSVERWQDKRVTTDESGKAVGQREMYSLAAAVSDFSIPYARVPEHTIQSGQGSLVIEMDPAPKALETGVDEWSNDGFILSFEARRASLDLNLNGCSRPQLELDRSLVIPKARTALERCGHQIVLGKS
ncbi:SPOSA6832_02528 [Sporobolomyces salmonicolor]|uniref:SPOSA6832_02528-mRNA-1:cds n=1 Tax=Sporidiobolus salmonicolor TaxID=5005 RepID=A0A0D6EMC3_SPOSA|nr:SPOSA6832_02528 [Sporobolomyces salmonicolor]